MKMSDRLHIRPVAGKLVRCPDFSFLPAEGKEVSEHPYWYRRLLKGDVEFVPQKTASKKEKD
jgi:hypothetical protein